MSDTFSLLGLDGDGWFARNFEEFHFFGYVGDRDKLQEAIAKKSIFRRLTEIFATRINIGTVINTLANYNLVHVDPKKTLASDIINLLNERENSRTITQFLESTYRRGRKKGTYFELISSPYSYKHCLFNASFNELHNQLITVEGQLLHRSAVHQFSKTTDAALKTSVGEWILGQFPPHCLVEANSSFDGKLLILKEDQGFTKIFSALLPFNPEISWYPYVRVTGFFDASRIQTEILPSLSISLVEYRRPKLFQEIRNSVLNFAKQEFKKPNWLDSWSNMLLFGYLAPLLFKGNNLEATDADPEFAEVFHSYFLQAQNELPHSLTAFYSSLPTGD